MCNADQFVQVVQPGQVLRIIGGLQLGAIAGAVKYRLDDVAEFVIKASAQFVEQVDESRDRLLRAGVEHRDLTLGRGTKRVCERAARTFGVDGNARLGAVADTAARGIQNPPQTHCVARVIQYAEVGDDIANLLAFVKPNSADHLVGDTGANEHLFHRSR